MEIENNQQQSAEEIQLHKQFDNVSQNLNELEDLVAIIEQYQNLDKIEKDMSPEDFAKINVNLGFALNSVYFTFLKANGMNIKDHKVTSELKRIQEYMVKIIKTTNSEQIQQPKRNFSVNTQAAGRILAATENANKLIIKQQEEQKQAVQNTQLKKDEQLGDAWEEELQGKQKAASKTRWNKGSLLPNQSHINWKDQVDKMMK